VIGEVWAWLTDPAHWTGRGGVLQRTAEHLAYSGLTVALAAVLAIPAGLWVGHTGRGRLVVVNLVNGARSVPTLGLLFLAIMLLGPRLRGDIAFLAPAIGVLVVLAVPPILAGAYAGVGQVDAGARDAARGMGMTGWEVLTRVEVPCAAPLIWSGLRSASLQVVATATIAATVSVGGLGRFLIDGQASRDYPQMAGGAILVALVALGVDGLLALVERWGTSPGLRTGRPGRRTAHAAPTHAAQENR